MAPQGIGPEFYINGPLPRRPRYGLIQNGEIVAEQDQHWANGIQVHGYIPDGGYIAGVCDPDGPVEKLTQQEANPLPIYAPLTAYLAETCSTRTMEPTNAAFVARATAVFDAVEGGAVEHEFWTGDAIPDNPHLADAFADVLNGGTATSLKNGLALLEAAIAETRRAGVIHMSAALAAAYSFGGNVLHDERGALYTLLGTLVIPGVGYDGSAPEGAAANTGTEEFAYATGPVEILRSEAFVMPPEIAQAIDRSQNVITYRAERYYIPFWDTALQAGVRIDRCLETCE
jgi:hypothetical protein